MTDTCAECRYFTPGLSSGAVGLCHRFPRCERVAPNYWCGEWTPKSDSDLNDELADRTARLETEMLKQCPPDDDDRTGM